ncbi:unnamed protein product [Bursaphelenchus xylophilus]|uniref:(pine wood nematode) hypothetical protein n=1 Tax=Bursaphelenchus xylophilus TaxID=6326 RepID=A0A1I7SRL8_BURXY|nr:unnamed protein product [Bursaphelenchus xylophilus]CAG9102179.1 unnamed protein product [Bursaphelenchus xylophilus]
MSSTAISTIANSSKSAVKIDPWNDFAVKDARREAKDAMWLIKAIVTENQKKLEAKEKSSSLQKTTEDKENQKKKDDFEFKRPRIQFNRKSNSSRMNKLKPLQSKPEPPPFPYEMIQYFTKEEVDRMMMPPPSKRPIRKRRMPVEDRSDEMCDLMSEFRRVRKELKDAEHDWERKNWMDYHKMCMQRLDLLRMKMGVKRRRL